jgi:multiple sugar transport system permease protein
MMNERASVELRFRTIPLARRWVRWRARAFPYFLVAPLVALMAAVTFYPALYAIWLSTTDALLLRLARAKFIGAGNFLRLLGDPIFLAGLWRTLRWDLVVVLSQMAIAIPMALFLDLSFRGRGFVRSALLVPYIIPPAVTALIWIYMLDGNFGVVNDVAVRLGVLAHGFAWLADPAGSFAAVSSAMVWSGQPLMAIMLLAVLQSIPHTLYEAASIDGAGPWQRFRAVTWPHLLPTVLFLLLMRTIWMSNHIDMIYIMTGGGPGFTNYTEAVYSFLLTTRYQIGYSAAAAMTLAVALMVLSLLYVRHLARRILA